MTLESRIEAGGRRVLGSPLWVGLAITAVLVLPTFLVPSVPLWVALVSLVTLTPLVLLGTYLLYFLYGQVSERLEPDTDDDPLPDEPESETPVALLQRRYVTDEIDEETFERMLDRLLETETPRQRAVPREREAELLNE